MVSSTPRPHFTPGKDLVPILQEFGWAPGPVWTGGKSRPHRDSIPSRPARSQSLYRLSYRPTSTGIALLRTMALDRGWEDNATPRPLFTLGKETRYPLYRMVSGSQGRSGRVRKISPFPLPGFDTRTVQPVASSYTE